MKIFNTVIIKKKLVYLIDNVPP